MNARQKIDKLILDHQKEFGFHSNFDFMNELLSEIEEERDAERIKALHRAKLRLIEMGNLVAVGSEGTYQLSIKQDAWHAIFMTDEAKKLGICP